MTDQTRPLRQAIDEELRKTHGLQAEEAGERAAGMEEALQRRFATWVRRELSIQRGKERGARAGEAAHAAAGGEEFLRLGLELRLQHALMLVSVILLIVTGLPLKFHEHAWAKAIIDFFGGPDFSPIVHRIAATGLTIAGIWHLVYIIFTPEGRGTFVQLLPRPQDALDAFQQIRYFLGLKR